jgi:hypothetical protein
MACHHPRDATGIPVGGAPNPMYSAYVRDLAVIVMVRLQIR